MLLLIFFFLKLILELETTRSLMILTVFCFYTVGNKNYLIIVIIPGRSFNFYIFLVWSSFRKYSDPDPGFMAGPS